MKSHIHLPLHSMLQSYIPLRQFQSTGTINMTGIRQEINQKPQQNTNQINRLPLQYSPNIALQRLDAVSQRHVPKDRFVLE